MLHTHYLTATLEVGSVLSHFQMRKWRTREVSSHAEEHTAGKWESQHETPVSLTPEPVL